MKIIIYQNREVYKENSKIGNDSENKVETLEFEFPEEYADFTKYIEFQIKGGKYVDLIEGNKYVITREVAKYGKIKTQIVLKKNIENDVMVFKSDIFTLNVSNSINASENLVNEVGVDLIEKIVTKNNEQDVRLDTLEADNIINKSNISNIQTEQTNQNNRLDSLELDNTTNKTDILNIKQEQITQNTNILNLQTDNTSNKSKIADLETKNAEQDNKIVSLETKNTEQDTSIQTNTESIEQIKEKDTTQDSLIEQLQAENTKLKKEINSMQIPGEATGNPIHLTDSSDLECEIVVKGNAGQETRSGKNKLNFDSLFGNADFITKNSDGTYSITGDGQAHFMLKDVSIPSNNNIFSLDYNENSNLKYSESGNLIAFNVVYEDGTSEWISLIKDTDSINTRISRTPTNNKNIVKLQLQTFTRFTGGTITFSNVQVASDDVYEPYGAMPSPDYPSPVETVGQNGSVEIEVCNGNILDFNVAQNSKVTVNDDGTLTINGAGGFSLNIAPITVKAGVNYYQKVELVSGDVSGVAISSAFMSFAGSNKWISNNNFTEVDLTEDIEKKTIWVNAGATFKDAVIRLWTNTDQSDFIPHQSYTKVLPIQKEFVKIGDVEDSFVKVDGKWYEKHYIGKRVFDGTENFILHTGLTNDNYLVVYKYITGMKSAPKNNLLSNYFIAENTRGIKNCIYGGYEEEFDISISKTIASTVDELKSKLAEWNNNGAPMELYYPLATPELIECTTEQEEILNSFYTYKGITNISVDGIGTLKVNYKKDLETIINNLSATSVAE